MKKIFSYNQSSVFRSYFILRYLFVLIVIFSVSKIAFTQNLVTNGDFETFNACPSNYAQITRSTGWIQPTPGTPDYYHICSFNINPYSNLAGYEPPNSGSGYAGIVLTNGTGAYREYIETKLTKTLVANRVYYFEMYVSLGDSCNFSSNKFGVHFSNDSIYSDSNRLFYTPQITTLASTFDNKNGWTKISSLYKAKGGERFISIGCFETTNTPNLTTYIGGGSATGSFSNMTYYYIDDVSLIDPTCDSIPSSNITNSNVLVCNNNQSFPKSLFPTYSGYTYLWNDSTQSTYYKANTVGKYWVYTYTNNCPYVDTFNIIYTSNPTLSIGNDTNICSSNLFTIKPIFTKNVSFLWSNNSTDSFLNVNKNGLYWLKITNNAGCTQTDSMNITFTVIPNVLGNNIDLCNNLSFPLKLSASASLANSYYWFSGATDSTVLVNDTGNYWVQMTKGTCTIIDTISIKNTPTPSSLLGKDTAFCNGNSFNLNVPNANSYQWFYSANTTNPVFTVFSSSQNNLVAIPGLYLLEWKKNGCIKKDTIKLEIRNKPIVNIGNDTLICFNKSINLSAYSSALNTKYLWQNGDTNANLLVSNQGMFWVKLSNDVCQAFDTINVYYENELKVNLGNDTLLCNNQVLHLNPSVLNATNFKWQNNSTLSYAIINNSGTYWLEVSKGICKVTDTIQVTFNQMPTVNLGPDTTYCKGQFFTYRLHFSGASYLWSNNKTDSFLHSNIGGIFWGEINNKGCKARDSVNITIFPLEDLNLGNDTSLCVGDTFSLNIISTNATNYLWNTGQTSIAIKPTSTGVYWAEASASICKVRDSISVTFKPVPLVNLGSDTVICTNTNFILDSKIDSATYLWDDFSINKTRTANSLGFYTVKVTKNGCSAHDEIVVTTENPPLLDLGNDTTLCVGHLLNLTANITGINEYLWQNNSNLPYFTVNTEGTYYLRIKKGYCYVTDSIKVSYVNKETINLGNDSDYCFNNVVILKPQILATTYLWQDASTLDSLVVTQPGTYWVEINSTTCKVRDSIILTQKTLPIIDLGGDKKVCINDTISLDAQNVGSEFIWEDLSNNQIHQVKAPGLFYVIVKNNWGCFAIDSIQLDTFPVFYTSLGKDTFVCQGSELKLQAEPGFKSYIWQDKSSLQNFIIKQPGAYFVTVTNINNCQAADTILVVQKPKPNINLTSLIKACEPNFTLNSGDHFLNYLWQDGSTKSTLQVKDYGIYQVIVTDSNYCENSAKTEVINYCEGKLIMPNAFTPNNDAINDTYKPVFKNLQTINFKIFNRWGQLIFETSEIGKGWNGKIDDNNAESDVYFYSISYEGNNQNSNSISGNFTLLR